MIVLYATTILAFQGTWNLRVKQIAGHEPCLKHLRLSICLNCLQHDISISQKSLHYSHGVTQQGDPNTGNSWKVWGGGTTMKPMRRYICHSGRPSSSLLIFWRQELLFSHNKQVRQSRLVPAWRQPGLNGKDLQRERTSQERISPHSLKSNTRSQQPEPKHKPSSPSMGSLVGLFPFNSKIEILLINSFNKYN